MRVLLITKDLYRTIGGGQTVYKKIIQAHPEIKFYYFREQEEKNAPRPSNTEPITLHPHCAIKARSILPAPAYQHALAQANQFARSVAGQNFDCIDIPDFYTFGSVLQDAFHHHRVGFEKLVLAMHGNISTSIEMHFSSCGDNVLEQRLLEQAQFACADAIYSISPAYIRQWKKIINRNIYYLDPIHFIDHLTTYYQDTKNSLPNLCCIGRMERRKGNDLLIEILRWLKPTLYDQAIHIGDADFSTGLNSQIILSGIAKHRDLSITFRPSYTPEHLKQLFQQRSVVILPVRYDSLNLIALEALFSGCPVAISSTAGVCDYLDQTFPEIPYLKIDLNHFYHVIPKLEDLLMHYDEHRARLKNALSKINRMIQPLDMSAIYKINTPKRSQINFTYQEINKNTAHLKRYLKTIPLYAPLKNIHQWITHPKQNLIRWALQSVHTQNFRFVHRLTQSRNFPNQLKKITHYPEHNLIHITEKLQDTYALAHNCLYRCNIWLAIARLERIRGNLLIAVTYELRVLRFLGKDSINILPRIIQTLNQQGFKQEAHVANLMYAKQNSSELIYNYLKNKYAYHQCKPNLPEFLFIDDRRSGAPKVSVIVSLYNAGKQIKLFLTALMQQTLIKKNQVELILIDSASTDSTGQIIQHHLETQAMNAIYVRARQRETIQSVWNYGIELSRAPYLVFLGADEVLYPETLQLLSDELDQNTEIDWVMGNSLVTEVNRYGLYENDVMLYDRSGATKNHAYLETCYLSWVGGMYRKTIHERYGYYDPTFSAAGDTEFKNRILPYINVKFIPKTLGLFLNYPDERKTASSLAEIEDLRAWYVHRTIGGIRYAFENRPHSDVTQLFFTALGYRKSYCQHLSSDIEYAAYLAEYLNEKMHNLWVKNIGSDLHKMLECMQQVEYTPVLINKRQAIRPAIKIYRTFLKNQKRHAQLLKSSEQPVYQLFNDNRYEQHVNLWKSPKETQHETQRQDKTHIKISQDQIQEECVDTNA
jgi:glycosyltransferase involved in cell wall biosynthesis